MVIDTSVIAAILFGEPEVVPFTEEQLAVARHAFRQYGKGRHPAGLNYGDCFGYALSRTAGEPLLFKGEDFSRTDVLPVRWRLET